MTRAFGLSAACCGLMLAAGCGGSTNSTTSPTTTSVPTIVVLDIAPAVTATDGCPSTLRFSASLTHNGGSGVVSYRWDYWDGTSSDVSTFSGPGNPQQAGATVKVVVSATAVSRVVTSTGSYWARIHVLTPADALFVPATATVTCPASP